MTTPTLYNPRALNRLRESYTQVLVKILALSNSYNKSLKDDLLPNGEFNNNHNKVVNEIVGSAVAIKYSIDYHDKHGLPFATPTCWLESEVIDITA